MCLPILSFDETARLRYSSYIFKHCEQMMCETNSVPGSVVTRASAIHLPPMPGPQHHHLTHPSEFPPHPSPPNLWYNLGTPSIMPMGRLISTTDRPTLR